MPESATKKQEENNCNKAKQPRQGRSVVRFHKSIPYLTRKPRSSVILCDVTNQESYGTAQSERRRRALEQGREGGARRKQVLPLQLTRVQYRNQRDREQSERQCDQNREWEKQRKWNHQQENNKSGTARMQMHDQNQLNATMPCSDAKVLLAPVHFLRRYHGVRVDHDSVFEFVGVSPRECNHDWNALGLGELED